MFVKKLSDLSNPCEWLRSIPQKIHNFGALCGCLKGDAGGLARHEKPSGHWGQSQSEMMRKEECRGKHDLGERKSSRQTFQSQPEPGRQR